MSTSACRVPRDDGRAFRMGGDDMRRRSLFVVVLAVLAASFAVPALAAASGGYSMQLGSTFTVSGRTGSVPGEQTRAVGKVVVEGRWGIGPWHTISSTRTDSRGNYRFLIRPQRRGNLTLRVEPPDHHPRRFVLHVH
jgi:hypothetical protein